MWYPNCLPNTFVTWYFPMIWRHIMAMYPYIFLNKSHQKLKYHMQYIYSWFAYITKELTKTKINKKHFFSSSVEPGRRDRKSDLWDSEKWDVWGLKPRGRTREWKGENVLQNRTLLFSDTWRHSQWTGVDLFCMQLSKRLSAKEWKLQVGKF